MSDRVPNVWDLIKKVTSIVSQPFHLLLVFTCLSCDPIPSYHLPDLVSCHRAVLSLLVSWLCDLASRLLSITVVFSSQSLWVWTQLIFFFYLCRCGTRTSTCLSYSSTSRACSWSSSLLPRRRRSLKSKISSNYNKKKTTSGFHSHNTLFQHTLSFFFFLGMGTWGWWWDVRSSACGRI